MNRHTSEKVLLPVLIFAGLAVRLALSFSTYNVDIENYIRDIEIFHKNGNIYAQQTAYNYTPVWYLLLGGLDTVRGLVVPQIPADALIRIFLSLIDVALLAALIQVARLKHVSAYIPVLLYFLNPIAVIISAKHGQFDNIALLFLVFAWVQSEQKKSVWMWILGTVALLTKHSVVFPLIALYLTTWGTRKGFSALIGTIAVFLLSFLPYVSAWRQIVTQVFLYGGVPGLYGISRVLTGMYRFLIQPDSISLSAPLGGISGGVRFAYIALTAATILLNIAFIIYIRRRVDTWTAMLLSSVFFLMTTSGIGAQYFLLPVVFGALRPSAGFVIYTILVTGFLLQSPDEFHIRELRFVSWNAAWAGVILWFITMKKLWKLKYNGQA